MSAEATGLVHVLDDDADVRESLGSVLRAEGFAVRMHATPQGFLDAYDRASPSCLLLDIRLQQADGLAVQDHLRRRDIPVPVILMTGHGDVPMAVRGMKAGAVDFLAKPFSDVALLAALATALERDAARCADAASILALRQRHDSLTPREKEVAALVAAGLMNKQIGFELALEVSTVKIHRGQVMRKMAAGSLADLVRMVERLALRPSGIGRHARPSRTAARPGGNPDGRSETGRSPTGRD